MAAEAAAGAPVPKEFRWYVVRVASNREERVRDNLLARVKAAGMAERIRNVLVPTEKFAEIKGGKRREGQRKIYPGYILVEMQLDESTWYPCAAPADRRLRRLRQHADADGAARSREAAGREKPGPDGEKAKLDIHFKVGDKVKIKEGPFENFNGAVDEVNVQKGVVRVIVMIFGRETPVELEYWQVEAI
jgi:transcriptional antiterminator NusG